MCDTSRAGAGDPLVARQLLLFAAQRLEVVDQRGERHIKAARELEHDAEGRVDLAALHRSDVVSVQAGTLSQDLLRQLSARAKESCGAAEVPKLWEGEKRLRR